MNPMWVPLVDYRRNGIAEVTVHGAIAWVSENHVVYSYGGDVVCYGRSMMKPFHMKVFTEQLDSELNWPQKAVSVSSHNAEADHIKTVMSILSRSEWGLMQTPLATPLMQFGRQLRRPRRWYHTCSGEHAAILRGCRHRGWSRVGYVWPHHPFHQNYIAYVKNVLGSEWTPLATAKDGCGLATNSMTVTEMASLFAHLVTQKNDDWIWECMVRHPDLIGGFNRLDSTILKTCDGKVIAKEGADGLLGLAIEHPDYPQGLGIVIKIAHGWNPQAMWYVARWVLGVLGFELRNPYRLHRQKAFIVPEVVPGRYRQRLSQIVPWDPWDPDEDKWDFNYESYISEN